MTPTIKILSITTLKITVLQGIVTLSVTAFSVVKLSKMTLINTQYEVYLTRHYKL
jgi:hypothetical protein